jgi:hypothetical protein
MDDQHETDLTGSHAPDAYVMSKFDLRDAIVRLEGKQEEPGLTGATSQLTINSVIETSWKQRVFSWFKRNCSGLTTPR